MAALITSSLRTGKETGYTFFLGHVTYFIPKRDRVGKPGTCKLALRRLGYKPSKANINKLVEMTTECLYESSTRLMIGEQEGKQFCEYIPDDREDFVRLVV